MEGGQDFAGNHSIGVQKEAIGSSLMIRWLWGGLTIVRRDFYL